MTDIFKGREEIAKATNKLFETGFYLLNIGFALKIMEMNIHFYLQKDKITRQIAIKND